MLRVEIINTGTELMMGFILNTHQQWLCRELSALGYVVSRQTAVPDTARDIQDAVRESMERAQLIIVTGGLGPTSDDRTRDLIAELLGKNLWEDKRILAHIEAFFAKRKRRLPESTKVQAMVPEGATVLWNDHGTAPGLAMDYSGGILIMLPGPPRELRPMFSERVIPLLAQRLPTPGGFACVTLKTTGLGESFVEERIAKKLESLRDQGLEIGYCARVGEVDVRLLARTAEAERIVNEAEAITCEVLKEFVYGRDPEQLDAVVVRLLTERGMTLAIAESCTGGFIANRITNISGASAVLLAGLVTYSNKAKEQFLGVKAETLAAHGAVSEAVAIEMAAGACERTGADFGLSVTGIAGPTGGTPEKPIGTVYIGLARRPNVTAKKYLNQYDRETFKYVTSQQALDWLRREILLATDRS
jgi:nicotinamide-nucleotide amidase